QITVFVVAIENFTAGKVADSGESIGRFGALDPLLEDKINLAPVAVDYAVQKPSAIILKEHFVAVPILMGVEPAVRPIESFEAIGFTQHVGAVRLTNQSPKEAGGGSERAVGIKHPFIHMASTVDSNHIAAGTNEQALVVIEVPTEAERSVVIQLAAIAAVECEVHSTATRDCKVRSIKPLFTAVEQDSVPVQARILRRLLRLIRLRLAKEESAEEIEEFSPKNPRHRTDPMPARLSDSHAGIGADQFSI